MAHDIDISTGQPALAYVGETPWHKLGERLPPDRPIEAWIKAARLDWHLDKLPVQYVVQDRLHTMFDRFVLVRSDTSTALSVVSSDYDVVQPGEVLEFYRDLMSSLGYTLETAGALNGGRKYWALARTGKSAVVDDAGKDELAAYVLLATSCDKTLATTAAFTSVRVVCSNTLGFAMQDIKGERRPCVKVSHDLRFKPEVVKRDLGLMDTSWEAFLSEARKMAKRQFSKEQAVAFFESLLSPKKDKTLSNRSRKDHQALMGLFNSGPGQNLHSAKGTLWGAVNATTRFVDHVRTGSNGERLDSAWFGAGNTLKEKAWSMASELIK